MASGRIRTIGHLRAGGGGSVDSDAAAWAAAVTSAGGTYSGTTLSAVSAFCVSAKANGYWTKLTRINLMCGDQLTAARVPLKVGGGNTIDTNVSFVSGNYTEATGLTGNGTTKYLKTGLVPSTGLTLNSTHLSVYNRSGAATGGGAHMGASDGTNFLQLFAPDTSGLAGARAYDSTFFSVAASAPYGLMLWARTATNAQALYQKGSSIASNTNAAGGALVALELYVFTYNSSGSPSTPVSHVLAGYSMGTGLTSAEASSFNADMQTFQTALGRNV